MTKPEPWVSPCPEDNRPVQPSLAGEVRDLTAAVGLLVQQYKAKRWKDRLNYTTTVAVVLFLFYYFLLVLPQRRDDIGDQISNLACYAVRLRPPGYSIQSDDLRAKYRCPPFDPSAVPSGAPSVEPKPGATVTRQVPTPGATRTVTRTPAAGRPAPTRTVQVPGPTVTAQASTRTVVVRPAPSTVTRTVTATRGVCLPVVC